MLDVKLVDEWFETGRELGALLEFRALDKRALIPLETAAHSIHRPAGTNLAPEELQRLAGRGWFELASSSDIDEGVPLYVPPRIELLLELEALGYLAVELRAIAAYEQNMIDHVYAADELAYIDDDVQLLVAYAKDQLLSASVDDRWSPPIDPEPWKRMLEMLRRCEENGIPDNMEYAIGKQAFRVRAHLDYVRITMLEHDRAKVRAGYSPWVSVRREIWEGNLGPGLVYSAGRVLWRQTIASAHAVGVNDQMMPTRIPGFRLCRDEVIQSRTMLPHEYTAEWERASLSDYLQTWSDMHGERLCPSCLAKIPDEADQRRMYCGEPCRNRAKQKRYRERNPDAIRDTMQKYWAPPDGEND